MRKLALISASILLGAALTGCTKQAIQLTYDKQEANIEKVVESVLKQDENATVEYPDGVVRVRLSASTSTESDIQLEKGGTVSFYYGGYTLPSTSISTSNLFATNLKELAEASGWSNLDESGFEVEKVVIGKGELVPGLEKGLVGVRKGDNILILFSGKYGWGNKPRGMVPARSALAWQIWVEDVTNE